MAVSAEQVREFVTRVIIDEMSLDFEPAQLSDDATLGPDGLDLESLAFVELTVALENEYNISFPDGELDELAGLTFGAFIAEIVRRLDRQPAV